MHKMWNLGVKYFNDPFSYSQLPVAYIYVFMSISKFERASTVLYLIIENKKVKLYKPWICMNPCFQTHEFQSIHSPHPGHCRWLSSQGRMGPATKKHGSSDHDHITLNDHSK